MRRGRDRSWTRARVAEPIFSVYVSITTHHIREFCKSTDTMAPLLCVAMALAALSQLNAGEVTTSSANSARSDSDSPPCELTTETATTPTRVGQNGYRRYFANDSFISTPIACSYEDKVCFKYNMLFLAESDQCEAIGDGEGNCDMRADRKEFQKRSGRLVGVCKKYEDPCPGYRMEYDQRCYRNETVRDVICGCGTDLTRHFLGGFECLREKKQPISVQQPPEEGRCLVPDLRFPDVERSAFFEKPQGFLSGLGGLPFGECSQRQFACFSNGSVSVAGHEGCFRLLERGPCPEDHIVALDAEAALEDRAEATCVHVRGGCAPGHKRMAFDGQCHENRAVAISVPGHIVWNAFGRNVVLELGAVYFNPDINSGGKCIIRYSIVANNWMRLLSTPPCGPNDKDNCALYELNDEPPTPEDD